MTPGPPSPEEPRRSDLQTEIRFDQDMEDRIRGVLELYPESRAALVPILHLCRERWGRISPAVVAVVAERLAIAPAAVEGVVSSYPMLSERPKGRHHLRVCTTLPCLLNGGTDVIDELKSKLDLDFGETTADGEFSLGKARCLGACDNGPAVQVDDLSPTGWDSCSIRRMLDDLG